MLSHFINTLFAPRKATLPLVAAVFGMSLLAISISAPASAAVSASSNIVTGATLSGNIAWTGTATSGVPIWKLEFFIDGTLKWTEYFAPYQYNGDPSGMLDTTTLSDGSHALMVKATDNNRATATYTANVSVNNSVNNNVLTATSTLNSVNILSNHTNLSNDGQNLKETALTTANLKTNFGKLFSVALDGEVDTQPLFMSGVNITAGPSPGVQDVVFVVTSNHTLYAINAYSGTVLWTATLFQQFHSALPTANRVYATAVISVYTNAIYVESEELDSSVGNRVYVLSAINLSDGSNYANPANIGEINYSYLTYARGPVTLSGKKFQGNLQSRSMTLNPVNNTVYVAYASGGDLGPFNGWVLGYSSVKDGSGNLKLTAVWCSTPNGFADPNNSFSGTGAGGIWQSGGAIAIDLAGNLYMEIANGTFDTTMATVPYNGRLSTDMANMQVPKGMDFGDSVVKLAPDLDVSQQSDNPNGYGLHVADYFTPRDEEQRAIVDNDLGSSSPLLLPDSVGSSKHPQLLVASSKLGDIFLIDRNNMGGYHGAADGLGGGTNNVVQELDGKIYGAWSTPAFFAAGNANSGTLYYVTNADFPKAFSITNAAIKATPTSTSKTSYGVYSYPGSTPQISANAGSNGIVWTLDKSRMAFVAYDASNLGTLLFRSDQVASNILTGAIKGFSNLIVANGHVYVGTLNALNAYGLH